MAEVCNRRSPTEVVTTLELNAKVDEMKKKKIEVKDNGMTKVEKYYRIYCVHVKIIVFLPF